MEKNSLEKAIDIVHDFKEPIKNVIEPVSKDAGEIAGTFTGFFNRVVLYPLRCLNVKFEQKAIAFERKMQEKYNNIPEANRQDIPVNILGPTLESLKYNIDEVYMQDMYANVLCSSMDNRISKSVHPRYVELIKNMNEVDAKIFQFLFNKYKNNYIKAGKINIHIKGTQQYYFDALPEWIILDEIENYTIFEISKALIRLSNLGLIDLMFDRSAGGSGLTSLYNKKEVQEIFNNYLIQIGNVELKGIDCIVSINDEGRSFAKIVFK